MKKILCLILLLTIYSCTEPVGIEESVKKSQLSDYQYLKCKIGTEWVYNTSEVDANNIQINENYEKWRVERIDLIDGYDAYLIFAYNENEEHVSSFYLSSNKNKVSIYSSDLSEITNIQNPSNLFNSNKFNWLTISDINGNWESKNVVKQDSVNLLNPSNNSLEYAERNSFIEISGSTNSNKSNLNNNNSLTNLITMNLYDEIKSISVSSNSNYNKLNIFQSSEITIEWSENKGISQISSINHYPIQNKTTIIKRVLTNYKY